MRWKILYPNVIKYSAVKAVCTGHYNNKCRPNRHRSSGVLSKLSYYSNPPNSYYQILISKLQNPDWCSDVCDIMFFYLASNQKRRTQRGKKNTKVFKLCKEETKCFSCRTPSVKERSWLMFSGPKDEGVGPVLISVWRPGSWSLCATVAHYNSRVGL